MKINLKTKFDKFYSARTIVVVTMLCLLLLSFAFSEFFVGVFKLNIKSNPNEVSAESVSKSSFEVCYLDVGQGNCSFVRLPDGKTMIIDGGTSMYGEKIVKFLYEREIEQIDYMIATHADSDHISGLVDVLDNFEVKTILRPFQICGTGSTVDTFVPEEYEDLGRAYEIIKESEGKRNKINRVTSGIYKDFIQKSYSETFSGDGVISQSEVMVFYKGLKISGENYCIEFYAPSKRTNYFALESCSRTKGFTTNTFGASDSNGNSAIFLLSCCNYKFLFTGDAPFKNGSKDEIDPLKFEESYFLENLTEDEKSMLKNVTVLLAGHHGSSYSTSEELLALTSPNYFVISVGANNNYGHPSSEVLFRVQRTSRLAMDYLLRTDRHGDIVFVESDGKIGYVKEKHEEDVRLPSWEMFSTVICLYLIMLIYSIKPQKRFILNEKMR